MRSASIVGEDAPWRSLSWGASQGDAFTITDLGLLLYEIVFLPGDTLLWMALTYAPQLARFLELGPQHYGGVLSGFLSGVLWLLLLLAGIMLHNAIRAADRKLTRWVSDLYTAALVLTRRARILLSARRHTRAKRAREAAAARVEEIALEAQELLVLDLHAELRPGYALATSEVAEALGVSSEQAQRVLSKLEKLRLLAGTIGGLEGEHAYTITRSGRGLVAFQRLNVPG